MKPLCHNPRVRFKTIGSILNVPQSTTLKSSAGICHQFLSFFLNRLSLSAQQ